jgi:uncharacterized integral membrane protein
MQALIWVGRIALMLLLVWFALKNAQPVTLYGFLDYNWQAPLVLILLVFFISGALFGVLAAFGTVFRLKRQLGQVKKQLKKAESELSAHLAVTPAQRATATATASATPGTGAQSLPAPPLPPHGD